MNVRFRSSEGSNQLTLDAPPLSDREFESLRTLIRNETGISLAPVKRDLLRTRLRKRLIELGIERFADYYQYLCSKDARGLELVELINSITTNKTDFFREPHHFSFLTKEVFPSLVHAAKNTGKKKLRIWSAACSTGQEPYSIAIAVREFFYDYRGWDIRILASDIDSDCLKKAVRGVYDEHRISNVPSYLRRRHFLKGRGKAAGKVSVRPELRDLITFRRINFADDPWKIKTTFDVIFCRNALIYFDRDFQEQLLGRFLRYLSPEGHLILGHSENVMWMDELTSIGNTIYRPKNAGANPAIIAIPNTTASSSCHVKKHETPTRQVADVKPKNSTSTQSQKPFTAPGKKRSIVAGEVFASNEDMEISTLLGSCIAACLYDPRAKVGGMNHFLLPEGRGDGADTACYGIHAMELLINELMMRGGERKHMVAKLYGGAHVLANELKDSRVGQKNVDFVRKYLSTEGIPIVHQKLGGKKALRVSMKANSGSVVATELEPTERPDLSLNDQRAITKANEQKRKDKQEQITFF